MTSRRLFYVLNYYLKPEPGNKLISWLIIELIQSQSFFTIKEKIYYAKKDGNN